MAQLVDHPSLDLGSGHDLMVHGFEHHVRVNTDSAEPTWDCLSPFLSASLSLSLTQNKYISFKKHFKNFFKISKLRTRFGLFFFFFFFFLA